MRSPRAFSLLEGLICIAIVAVLLSVLLPMLTAARTAGRSAACASNLRQIGFAWALYVQENGDRLPRAANLPEWNYGGVQFTGLHRVPVLAMSRPINRYLDPRGGEPDGDGQQGQTDVALRSQLTSLFECPADAGVFARGSANGARAGQSILSQGTCYKTFGNSYKANVLLLDAAQAGVDDEQRPLRLAEITSPLSRVMLMGDTAWFYAAPGRPGFALSSDAGLEASWHARRDAGNMASADGSVRFERFAEQAGTGYVLSPRP